MRKCQEKQSGMGKKIISVFTTPISKQIHTILIEDLEKQKVLHSKISEAISHKIPHDMINIVVDYVFGGNIAKKGQIPSPSTKNPKLVKSKDGNEPSPDF